MDPLFNWIQPLRHANLLEEILRLVLAALLTGNSLISVLQVDEPLFNQWYYNERL